jgi:hypothetical protein
MDEPLVGSRETNYRFFYAASGAAITSLVVLMVITGYTAFTATHVGHLMTDMTEVVDDIRVILPDVEESINLLKAICKHENFTRHYGHICG